MARTTKHTVILRVDIDCDESQLDNAVMDLESAFSDCGDYEVKNVTTLFYDATSKTPSLVQTKRTT